MFTLKGGKYWVKKINGKIHHFGTDDDQAVKKYLREKPYLEAGIPVPGDGADKVAELLNSFLSDRNQKCQNGKLSERTYEDYEEVCFFLHHD